MSHRGVALEKMGVSEHQGSGRFETCGSSRVLDGVEGLCDSVYRMDSGLGDRLWAQGRNVSTQGSIIFGFERGSTRA